MRMHVRHLRTARWFLAAIGEDMHMFIKAYVKTKGECKIKFVPAPINMGHVEGNGYLGTIWARILQARCSFEAQKHTCVPNR